MRPLGWALIYGHLSIKKRRGDLDTHTHREDDGKTEREDGHVTKVMSLQPDGQGVTANSRGWKRQE